GRQVTNDYADEDFLRICALGAGMVRLRVETTKGDSGVVEVPTSGEAMVDTGSVLIASVARRPGTDTLRVPGRLRSRGARDVNGEESQQDRFVWLWRRTREEESTTDAQNGARVDPWRARGGRGHRVRVARYGVPPRRRRRAGDNG